MEGKEIQDLAALGVAMDIAEFRPGVSLLAEFSESELESIRRAGFTFEVLIEDMSSYYQQRNAGIDRHELNRTMGTRDNGTPYPTPENFSLGSMGGFHTYSEAVDELDDMRALFPGLISERLPIGTTNTIEGRPVHWVRISNNPDQEQDKPKVLYTALTHAREPASLQQMLFQMWYLLENYESDPEIQYLIDSMEMYFVPVVNPDGYVYCETTHPNGGSMHRKNMRINPGGSIGVDLNRNFGYMWGYDNSGSSPNPSAQTYRGTAPFSEPETQLQKELAESYDFILALNNHTFSDLLIYPWGFNGQQTTDGEIFTTYAAYMTRENGYVYGTCYETLGYFANGVSDDWFYGEQDTKDKVFAFTPEAGKPSDGFWPAIHRIEEICAGHTHMNLGLARLALAYAEVTDLGGNYLDEDNAEVHFSIHNLGQNSPATFTVSVIPLSSGIIGAGQPVTFQNMEVLDSDTGSIGLELHPYLNTGDEIRFVLSLDNGDFAWNDTITKYYGQPELVFFDPGENLDNWSTTSWGICTQHYHSAPSSITDSPGSDYPNNAYNTIVLNQGFDFSEVSLAWIEFYTRFAIETNWDYVQLMYSTNNQQSWTPLAGDYTSTGGSNQDPGQPLYHGTQSDWVQEHIDLSHLAGEEEVWFKFRLVSDHIINWEGFYFDDFSLFTLQYEVSHHFFPPEEIAFYQHEMVLIDFADYVNWELEGDISLSWEDSELFLLELVDLTKLSIQSADHHWTGSQDILFTISDDLATLEANVGLSSEAVPAPLITGQEEVEMMQGHVLDFDPLYLHVEDDLFDYPGDFQISLHPGENYHVTEELRIIPHEAFSGWLHVPSTVNNGFQDSNTFDFAIEVQSGLDVHETGADQWHIYYDAVRGDVVIESATSLPEQTKMRIVDMQGRVMTQEMLGQQKVHRRSLAGFSPGIYIVVLEGPSQRLNQKISVR